MRNILALFSLDLAAFTGDSEHQLRSASLCRLLKPDSERAGSRDAELDIQYDQLVEGPPAKRRLILNCTVGVFSPKSNHEFSAQTSDFCIQPKCAFPLHSVSGALFDSIHNPMDLSAVMMLLLEKLLFVRWWHRH